MVSPLQAGIPGGPEMLLVLAITGVFFIIALAVSVFIYRDADRRNSSHPIAWAVGAFIGGFWVWVLYYVVRDDIGPSGPTANETV